MHCRPLALAATLLVLFACGLVRAQNTPPYALLWDDFRQPFSVGTADARWFYFAAGSYVGDDGIVANDAWGLHVVPSGRNPYDGAPAFARTIGQEHENGGLPGTLDHVKWLAFMNHRATSGIPGFDALPGRVLSCDAGLSGRTLGMQYQPFGAHVADPADDLRLAAFAQVAIDFESFVVFDYFVTNRRIYAYYERLPFGRTPTHDYAAFTFAIPVADYRPGDLHALRIAYDRDAGIVRWLIDGREVYRLDRIGRLIDRHYMIADLGGTEEDVAPRQLDCGMGMFTLLDGGRDGDIGLVRLSDAPGLYFAPSQGMPAAQDFVDNLSLYGNRLFGQGAELRARWYAVSSTPR